MPAHKPQRSWAAQAAAGLLRRLGLVRRSTPTRRKFVQLQSRPSLEEFLDAAEQTFAMQKTAMDVFLGTHRFWAQMRRLFPDRTAGLYDSCKPAIEALRWTTAKQEDPASCVAAMFEVIRRELKPLDPR